MHDPIAASRRTALRAVAVAAVAAALVALPFLAQGPTQALAAAWGGAVMAAGQALAAALALGGGVAAAGAAFARLLLGALAKWAVALAGFAIGLAVWRLPPLPMLAGLTAVMLAYLWALNRGKGRT